MSRNKIILGVALALTMILLTGLFLTVGGSQSTDPALPNPNGYELIRRASEMVNPRGKESFLTLSEAELTVIVRDQQAALDLARRGLALPARVPLPASMPEWHKRSDLWLRRWELSQLFVREARLSELRGDYRAAARSYLDVARLGAATSRGGTVGDLMVGHGFTYEGAIYLARISTNLGPEDCRGAAAVLKEQIELFPALAENQANQAVFFKRNANFRLKLLLMVGRQVDHWKKDGATAFLHESAVEKLARIRKSADELEARATELERDQSH